MFGWISKLGIKGRQSSRPDDNATRNFHNFLLLRVYPCLVSVLIGAYAAYYLAVVQDTDTVTKDLLIPSAVALLLAAVFDLMARISYLLRRVKRRVSWVMVVLDLVAVALDIYLWVCIYTFSADKPPTDLRSEYPYFSTIKWILGLTVALSILQVLVVAASWFLGRHNRQPREKHTARTEYATELEAQLQRNQEFAPDPSTQRYGAPGAYV